MTKRVLLFVIFLFSCLLFFYSPWHFSKHWLFKRSPYAATLTDIQRQRNLLAKQKVDLPKAGTVFANVITHKIFPHWYGTFWSFNGTTQLPGRGSIACGYFVTTVLRDAGLKIDRSRLAQMPSEQMIRSLVAKKHIRQFSHQPIGVFVEAIHKSGPGLYLVGLDDHTGFLVYNSQGIWFVHASGAFPFCVISENAIESAILNKSGYRVVGKISADRNVLQKWLNS